MNKDIFNSIKTKNKIIFQAIAITLLIAFICCNVYDDARMQEDYKDIKDEILQKHLKQPTDVTSNAKPTGLSAEIKQKLFNTGIGYLEKDTTVEKLKKVIDEQTSIRNNFSKEVGEFPALLNKLKGAYKEEFIHGNFKLEKIKLEAEEAIKAIPEDKPSSVVEPQIPQGGPRGDLNHAKKDFEDELQKAYDSYFTILFLCMYSKPHHNDNKVAEGRIVDFFKGTPDDHGDSIVSVLAHIEAVKNRAFEFTTCLSTTSSDNNGGANQVPECYNEVKEKYKYPTEKNKAGEVALVAS